MPKNERMQNLRSDCFVLNSLVQEIENCVKVQSTHSCVLLGFGTNTSGNSIFGSKPGPGTLGTGLGAGFGTGKGLYQETQQVTQLGFPTAGT